MSDDFIDLIDLIDGDVSSVNGVNPFNKVPKRGASLLPCCLFTFRFFLSRLPRSVEAPQ